MPCAPVYGCLSIGANLVHDKIIMLPRSFCSSVSLCKLEQYIWLCCASLICFCGDGSLHLFAALIHLHGRYDDDITIDATSQLNEIDFLYLSSASSHLLLRV